jgi:hypothetical protein
MRKSNENAMTYLVPEAGEMIGLTRNASYAAANRGDIPTIRIGKLIRVPKMAFHRMLEGAGVIDGADRKDRA